MADMSDMHVTGKLVAPEITEMLAGGYLREVRAALVSLFDVEIADVLMELEPRYLAPAFRLLPRDRATEVFTFLPNEQQENLLGKLGSQQMAQLFTDMPPDDRVELFEELPGRLVTKLLSLMGPEQRQETQVILGYPEDSIGRHMTPNYVRVRPDWTVQEVLDHIRRRESDAETLDTLYVADHDGKLVADVRLHDILLAQPDVNITTLMSTLVPSLNARDDQEIAVLEFERHDRPVLPVVDSQGELVGVVTFDDVADVAEEEVTEDIHKMAAVEALEEPYLNISIPTLVRKRGIWLGILFLGQMLTINAMESFENALDKLPLLVLFVPLLISSGGNTGSQAASLVIRAMAIGEIRLGDWWRILLREFACGCLLGLFLGSLGALRILIGHVIGQQTGSSDYGAEWLLLSLAIGTALVGIVIWGTFVGGMLPLLFRRLGVDPATSSAPFVTTIVDISGIVIYFLTVVTILRGSLT
ncbi:MAG: magnesium transporter [Planctomycetota bacterium]